MRAARQFAQKLEKSGKWDEIATVKVELFGSLAMTGKGHATDIAVLLGLEGNLPEAVNPNDVPHIVEGIQKKETLRLLGVKSITFKESEHLLFHKGKRMPYHSNAMRCSAYSASGEEILHKIYYSVGGGFVVDHDQISKEGNAAPAAEEKVPFPVKTAEELLAHCRRHDLMIYEVMMANEKCLRSEEEIRKGILNIWDVMQQSVKRGCEQEGILPGGLNVRRRAKQILKELQRSEDAANLSYSFISIPQSIENSRNSAVALLTETQVENAQKITLKDPSEIFDWVSLFALAVNEENAAGGRVVTAPTNGASGIIPAVLHYYQKFTPMPTEEGIVQFFLTAAAIGILYKEGASLSAAEMGCQGEVGVACSMAAGGLTAALGGTNEQIENAAEIGMEHNLGLTCDPIAGLVQIPCIERNTMGAIKAINGARLALRGDGQHRVSLDQVISAMRHTGEDMKHVYKETAEGGLAIYVPVSLPEC
jgi:L-serine dehydratase